MEDQIGPEESHRELHHPSSPYALALSMLFVRISSDDILIPRLAGGDVNHQTFVYNSSAGTGMFIYVVDPGIRISHSRFPERPIKGINVWPEVAFDDDFGNGTHIHLDVTHPSAGHTFQHALLDVKLSIIILLNKLEI
ncbi:alkaline proteinase [Colletotrichum orchidophilum]|uniref:Alkaline proteinase n=1 Tax=Colletotrichum orchidophilum TaxID=1209926 RepID=A0A1G4BLW5_9PEZI|nr:alkaline proteinase [Colletotrichum orchidophilum]OHF02298.1 alkaline proteinase [Colletotrichum orchidophilum]